VCEGFRRDGASRHLLQMVVPYGCRRAETIPNVLFMDNPALCSGVRPYTRQAIRLQLQHHGELISLPRIARLQLAHALFDAKDILDMMTKLMGDHIGLGKVCRAAADTPQLIPEAQIDVDLFVCRAVERPCLRLSRPTAGACVIPKQDELGMTISLTRLLRQQGLPLMLNVIEHIGDELRRTIVAHAEAVAARLRADERRARTVVLKIKLAERLGPGEYRVLTRQAPLPEASDDGAVITAAALELWERHRPGRAVRLLGVTATNIAGADEAQLALFDDPRGAARRRLNAALDRIVGRFGSDSIHRAVARPEKASPTLQVKRGEQE